jgi:GT2 family glycosyltransferase
LKTTILIVNYNGHADTIECLQSIFAGLFESFNIVIVDNSDNDSSYKQIINWLQNPVTVNTLDELNISFQVPSMQYHFFNENIADAQFADNNFKIGFDKEVFIIKAKKNNGFAAANNVGLKFIQKYVYSDIIWLLNNDTVIGLNALSKISEYFSKNNTIGIGGTKLLEYHLPNQVQMIGGHYNKFTGFEYAVGGGKPASIDLSGEIDKVSYPSGASMIVTKDFLTNVGLMYENYFLFFEEIDWVLRGKQKQLDLGIILNAEVWHKGGASINVNSTTKSKLYDCCGLRSRLLFAKKFYRSMLPFVYFFCALLILKRAFKMQFDRLPILLKIYFNPSIPMNEVFKGI